MGSVRIKGVVVVEVDLINFPSIELDKTKANHGLATGSGVLTAGGSILKQLETLAVATQDSTTFLLAVALSPRRFDADSKTESTGVRVVETVSIIVGVEFHSRSRGSHETLFVASSFFFFFFKVNIEIRGVVDWRKVIIVIIYNQLLAALRPIFHLKTKFKEGEQIEIGNPN